MRRYAADREFDIYMYILYDFDMVLQFCSEFHMGVTHTYIYIYLLKKKNRKNIFGSFLQLLVRLLNSL